MELLELHFNEVALLVTATHFPTGSFKEESSNVGTCHGESGVILNGESVLDSRLKTDIIERHVFGASSYLHDSRQVGHGVEQARDPQNRGCLKVVSPFYELCDTLKEFSEPLLERLLC